LQTLGISVWCHSVSTHHRTLPFSWRSSRISTRSTIFSATCRFASLKCRVICLQNAVTASVVWKRSSARSRTDPPSS